MQLKALLTDDDAVSPVIGVILMVAITVILAAVIGTFVLGLGDKVQDSAPNVNWEWDYDTSATTVTITHDGGQDVEGDNIELIGSSTGTTGCTSAGTYSTGDDIVSSCGYSAGEDLRIVWSSPSGGSSQPIGEDTAPN